MIPLLAFYFGAFPSIKAPIYNDTSEVVDTLAS